MLKIEKCNETINNLETELLYQNGELEEQQNEYMLFKFDLIRSLFASILFLAFLAFVVFLLVFPPTKEFIAKIMSIDFSNFPRFNFIDTMFLLGTYSIIVVIGALFVSWGVDEDYQSAFITTLFPPIGFIYLVNTIFVSIKWRKKIRIKIKQLRQKIAALEAQIVQEKSKQQAMRKTIEESHLVFEQGKADENEEMIQYAADMGNPAAITYMEELNQEQKQIKAEQYYRRAHDSDLIDQRLLEKAAQMGHPYAVIELVEQLFVKVNSSLFTQIEKKELRKQASYYLGKADFTDCPDGQILSILAQLGDKNEVDRFELLSWARNAMDSGRLSPRYDQLAEQIIKRLVKEVDELQTNI